jgi:hypothetical protein
MDAYGVVDVTGMDELVAVLGGVKADVSLEGA